MLRLCSLYSSLWSYLWHPWVHACHWTRPSSAWPLRTSDSDAAGCRSARRARSPRYHSRETPGCSWTWCPTWAADPGSSCPWSRTRRTGGNRSRSATAWCSILLKSSHWIVLVWCFRRFIRLTLFETHPLTAFFHFCTSLDMFLPKLNYMSLAFIWQSKYDDSEKKC